MPRGISNKPKAPAVQPEPETPPVAIPEPLFAVQLVRDHWIGTERHRVPEVLELPAKEAMRLVSIGVAKTPETA